MKEAIEMKYNELWRLAMDETIIALRRNHTWNLDPFPDGRNPSVVNCRSRRTLVFMVVFKRVKQCWLKKVISRFEEYILERYSPHLIS